MHYVCLHFVHQELARRSEQRHVSLQGGSDLLINDLANQINNPTSVDRVCYRVAARRPSPLSFSGAVHSPPPRPILWKTWFIFGSRQSSIRSLLMARLAFPRPRRSDTRSGTQMPKKSTSSSSKGLTRARRARSRRKTRLPRGVTSEWQLEGLMIPSRES